MTTEPRWTLDELVRLVGVALAGSAYPGSPNGRVRDVPDRRSVRWYATIGLVDRPAAMRGRTALYGPRHLAQLIAVKRRQAEGASLAEIQAELTGATDATLRRVARVPDELLAAEPVASAATTTTIDVVAPEAPSLRAARFWAAPAAPDATPLAAKTNLRTDNGVTALTAVALPGGALLLLPARPDDDDLTAIHAAARPLLDVLADRGLLPTGGRNSR